MAATFQFIDDVRFFENAVEIVAVPAAEADWYIKQHRFITREIIEHDTLVQVIESGKSLCVSHRTIKVVK